MKKFEVRIHKASEHLYLTSFTHPLIKKKVRKTFNNIEEAEAYKKEFEQKFSRKSASSYAGLNLEELLVIFINNNLDSPFVKSKTHLIDFFDTFGSFQVDEISTAALRVWLEQIRFENNLTETSMCGLKCQLQTFFIFLEEQEIISNSPLREVYFKRQGSRSLLARNLLNPQEIKKLLEAVKAFSPGYLYPITLFFAETAVKVSEMCELQWDQVNFDEKTVYINSRPRSQARTLKLSDELVDLLKERPHRTKLVFETYRKTAFNKTILIKTINEFKNRKLFHRDWTPSDLRHSFAVNFLSTGGSYKELKYLLGIKQTQHVRAAYGEALTAPKQTIIHPFN